MPEYYEITIKSHLSPHWTEWFEGLQMTHLETDETLLFGWLPDQSALHGLLERIRDLNLTLISVSCGRPSTQSPDRRVNMKGMIISYSLSGNNEALAGQVATTLGADHVRITEPKRRSMGTIVFDIIFNRTPKIDMAVKNIEAYDWILFVGPVWMGQIATPFRGCFKQLGPRINTYAFASICGGADGPNPKLADELTERLAKAPACVVDLHIADLLPSEPKPARKDTMSYRITQSEVETLTETILTTLHPAVLN